MSYEKASGGIIIFLNIRIYPSILAQTVFIPQKKHLRFLNSSPEFTFEVKHQCICNLANIQGKRLRVETGVIDKRDIRRIEYSQSTYCCRNLGLVLLVKSFVFAA